MSELLLIGGGGHCKAAIDVVEQEGNFSIIGVTTKKIGECESVLGYPDVGTDDDLSSLVCDDRFFLVAIGQINTSEARITAFNRATSVGMQSVSIRSPKAYVSPHAAIGDGALIMHGAIVNADAQVGINSIVNSLALVEHDSIIGDHCHISTGAKINGNVIVGEKSFIGSGAVLRNGISVGARSIIGAGCYVDFDVPEDAIVRSSRKDVPNG